MGISGSILGRDAEIFRIDCQMEQFATDFQEVDSELRLPIGVGDTFGNSTKRYQIIHKDHIFNVQDLENKTSYAMKFFPFFPDEGDPARHQRRVIRELKHHWTCQKVLGVVSMECLFISNMGILMVMPLGVHDFYDSIHNGTGLAERERYGMQLAHAIRRLHEKGIAHLDIKPNNAIVSRQDMLEICDFGHAMTKDQYLELEYARGGTARYMPPESFYYPLSSDDIFKQDVWSYGITMYEVFTGRTPFSEDNTRDIIDSIKSGGGDIYYKMIPEGWANVIFDCLQVNPDLRPHARDLADRVAHCCVSRQTLYDNV